MSYSDLLVRTESGATVMIPVDELLRIMLSGFFPDGTAYDGISVGAVSLPTTIVHGQKTVAAAGTEEALGSSTTLTSGVRIKALSGNTGNVFVGANPVTSSTGFVLEPGEEAFIEVANLATVYLDVATNGDGVSYIGA